MKALYSAKQVKIFKKIRFLKTITRFWKVLQRLCFENDLKQYNGYYIHRLLVNHFAVWVNKKYAYKISLILDEHFENLRMKKEIIEKNDKIDELIRLTKEQTKTIKEQNSKIDKLNNKIDNLTSTVKHGLETLTTKVKI